MNVIITSTTLTGKQHKRIIKNVEMLNTISENGIKLVDDIGEEFIVYVDTYTKLEIIDSIFGRYLQ